MGDLLAQLDGHVQGPGIGLDQVHLLRLGIAPEVHEAGHRGILVVFPAVDDVPVAAVVNEDILEHAPLVVVLLFAHRLGQGVNRVPAVHAALLQPVLQVVVAQDPLVAIPSLAMTRLGTEVVQELQAGRRADCAFLAPDDDLAAIIRPAAVVFIRPPVERIDIGIHDAAMVHVLPAVVVLVGIQRLHPELARFTPLVRHHAPGTPGDGTGRIQRVGVAHVALLALVAHAGRLVGHVVVHHRGMTTVALDHAQVLLAVLSEGELLGVHPLEATHFAIIHQPLLVGLIERFGIADTPVVIEHVKTDSLGYSHLFGRQFRRGDQARLRPEAPADRRNHAHPLAIKPEHGIGADPMDIKPAETERLLHYILDGAFFGQRHGTGIQVRRLGRPELGLGYGDRNRGFAEPRRQGDRLLHRGDDRATGNILDNHFQIPLDGFAAGIVHGDRGDNVPHSRGVPHPQVGNGNRLHDPDRHGAADAAEAVAGTDLDRSQIEHPVIPPVETATGIGDAKGNPVLGAGLDERGDIKLIGRIPHHIVSAQRAVDIDLAALAGGAHLKDNPFAF